MKVGDLVGLTELYKQEYRNFPSNDPRAGVVVKVRKKMSEPSEILHIKVLWSNWNGDTKLKTMRPNWVEVISESR
jgi:hypothetical protein